MLIEKMAVDNQLGDVYQKIMDQQRLSMEDGVRLYHHPNLLLVGSLANIVRERLHGDKAYFNQNLHINYTNICNKFCKFCAFQRTPKQEGAYTMSLNQVEERIQSIGDQFISEVHMVAGINPKLNYQYYLDLLRTVKNYRPDIHIKAFTMVELYEIVRLAKKPIPEVLQELKEAGLGSCPGGGCEVLSDRVHQEIFPLKIGPQEWKDMARYVHQAGLVSNATMLYGHIETVEEKVDHLIQLRNLQDETGGFVTFIPLAFHPDNTEMSELPGTTAEQDLRNIAVSRLMLDNFDHIKAFWIMITPAVSQLALSYGADDMDGTVIEEKITHDAGATTPQGLTREQLIKLILNAGRKPVERDTRYNIIATSEELTEIAV